MFDLKLYIAVETEVTHPTPLSELLTSGGDYLNALTHEGRRYLVKQVEAPTSAGHINRLEANVISLVQRLQPDYSPTTNPPILLTCM